MAKSPVSSNVLPQSPLRFFALLIAAAIILIALAGGTRGYRRIGTNLGSASGQQTIAKFGTRTRAMNFYPEIPMSFEANDARDDTRTRFTSRGRGYRLLLTDEGATFAFKTNAEASISRLKMTLLGANHDARISGIDKLPGRANYFFGRDPNGWKKNVASYSKVRYEEVYPGIDLVFYGKNHDLEYDFKVQPAARPADIGILISGMDRASSARIDPPGDLALSFRGSEVRLHRPIAYQRGPNGEDFSVAARYVLSNKPGDSDMTDLRVGIKVGVYDRSKVLVIDPVLTFSTYLGGEGYDRALAIAVDSVGDTYVVGETYSTNFPTKGAIQPTLHGSNGDAFVTKMSADGSAILYSTYLGGSFSQEALGVAVDSAGEAYVVGETGSSDFPVTTGAFQTSCCANSGLVAFVTKLDSTGSQLLYSTFLGGTGGDSGEAIAIDASGLAYITGGSFSADFPITTGAFQRMRVGGNQQVFVAQFGATGSSLNYSTYLGAGEGFGIATNGLGNAYVVGEAVSSSFPTTPGAIQTTFGGPGGSAGDAFITELNSSGSALSYSTFLGGENEDGAQGVAIDSNGNAYVTGLTFSQNFPVLNAFQQTLKGMPNAFIAKVTPDGSSLAYSTYFGGSNADLGNGIAVDASGNSYVTGSAQSSDFPLVGALQSDFGGVSDSFLAVLDQNGSPFFSTYFGGEVSDIGTGVAVDSAGNAYLTGFTQSADFPITFNAFQPMLAGGGNCSPSPCPDGFVAKIAVSTPTPSPDFALALSSESASIGVGQTTNFSIGLTPTGGFNQTVSLSCSAQPSGPTCLLDPSALMLSGLGSSTASATVNTTEADLSPSPSAGSGSSAGVEGGLVHTLPAGLFVIVPFAFLFKWKRLNVQSKVIRVGIFASLCVVVLLQACGGGSGSNGGAGGGGGGGGGIKPGTYNITITATSGSLSHSKIFTLTVT